MPRPRPPLARSALLALLVPLSLAGTACLQDQPLPWLGACAEYPDGTYEYGQIGIGTCLAGPAHLAFAENDGDPALLVSNTNHLGTFTGGSLVAIPWEAVDLGAGRNVISDLSPVAVDLPAFAGGFDLWQGAAGSALGDLVLVGTRESEDSRTRVWPDQVWLVDADDAAAPALAEVSADGTAWVEVESDPTDVAIDDRTGLAFVVNRTSHSVSVLDLTGDVVERILPWPEQSVTEADLVDVDGSGSSGELSDLEIYDDALVPDEAWTLSWVEGSWRVWLPEAEGLVRWTTTGAGTYTQSNLGPELTTEDAAIAVGAIADPALLAAGSEALMYFADPAVDDDGDGVRDSGGAVYVAVSSKALAQWTIQSSAALSPTTSGWDAIVDAPSVVVGSDDVAMFYGARDAVDTENSLIGRATSADGYTFTRLGDPLWTPVHAYELGGVDDPDVWFDTEIGLWRMVFTASDGETRSIGHATSADLYTWVQDDEPVFALDGVELAAPTVTYEPGVYRMWVAMDDGAGWVVAEATSPDGYDWALTGAELPLEGEVDGPPPGVAVQATVDRLFRLSRGSTGDVVGQVEGGGTVLVDDYGLIFGVATGFQLGTDAAGTASAGGVALGSVDPATGTAWYTLTDAGGTPSIGVGAVDGDGAATVESAVVLAAQEDWEDRGVADPVVVDTGGGYVMLYAALRRDTTAIARATSPDGRSWTRDERVLQPGEEWDSVEVRPGSVVIDTDGTWRLYYSGSDGETWRIGEATSTDQGATWTRAAGSAGYSFTTGTPGEWDDSGVRDPYVVVDEDGAWHMWYAGFDGDAWRIGYASRPDADATWVRFEDAISLEKRAILGLDDSLFHPDGAARPIVLTPAQAAALGGDGRSWMAWYAGRKDEADRVGRAQGRGPDALHRVFRRPTAGDTLTFLTERGDATQEAIPLDTEVDGSDLTAIGIASVTVDDERGFLYVVGKLRPYIFVIDIRDDSPLADGSPDLNYLDIEAVIASRSASGADGYRQVVPLPGTDLLYAINDSPDAVWVVDVADLQDDAWSDILYDKVVGSVPAPRGSQRDEGVTTLTNIGVGQLLLHPDGQRLFISNFNSNSVGVVDLRLGPWGTWTHELTLLGENPFAMALSPDGDHLVVGNYTGEVADTNAAESTLVVIDVDPESPTYLGAVTWIANR